MYIISGKPVRYNGRFHNEAVALVKKGIRVGMMWLSGENEVRCHVCCNTFPPPELDKTYHDHLGNCPKCNTTFIFADLTHLGFKV